MSSSSSSSSSLMTSHGVALATAVAVSGTMIVLALRRQKPSFPIPAAALDDPNPAASWCRPHPRSCISNSAERKLQNRKKKRVQFAAEVVEFAASRCNEEAAARTGEERPAAEEDRRRRRMPANRVALYNGILRDRVMQRTTYSY